MKTNSAADDDGDVAFHNDVKLRTTGYNGYDMSNNNSDSNTAVSTQDKTMNTNATVSDNDYILPTCYNMESDSRTLMIDNTTANDITAATNVDNSDVSTYQYYNGTITNENTHLTATGDKKVPFADTHIIETNDNISSLADATFNSEDSHDHTKVTMADAIQFTAISVDGDVWTNNDFITKLASISTIICSPLKPRDFDCTPAKTNTNNDLMLNVVANYNNKDTADKVYNTTSPTTNDDVMIAGDNNNANSNVTMNNDYSTCNMADNDSTTTENDGSDTDNVAGDNDAMMNGVDLIADDDKDKSTALPNDGNSTRVSADDIVLTKDKNAVMMGQTTNLYTVRNDALVPPHAHSNGDYTTMYENNYHTSCHKIAIALPTEAKTDTRNSQQDHDTKHEKVHLWDEKDGHSKLHTSYFYGYATADGATNIMPAVNNEAL